MHLPPFLQDLTIPFLDYHQLLRDWYRTVRRECPVMYDEDHHVWMVFGYEDALQVRKDYHTFTAAQNIADDFPTIAGIDPPRHTKMRSLVTQAMSARTIANLEPRIAQLVETLLQEALAAGEMDWVQSVAHPLPIQVIASMLGLPLENWRAYRDCADAIVNQRANWSQSVQNLWHLFSGAIEEHRAHPTDDILSLLIAAEVEGTQLDYMELIGFCFTLFIAGYITTAHWLGNAILCFNQHPDTVTHLQQHPDLLPQALEEVLRYMHPVRGLPGDVKLVEGRTATRDVVLHGQHIREGDHVRVDHLSVNFDEDVFTDADTFDILRSPNRHQGFGHGVHFCIGAPLARMEAKAALGAFLQKTRNIHLASSQPIRQFDSHLMLGPGQLLLTFETV